MEMPRFVFPVLCPHRACQAHSRAHLLRFVCEERLHRDGEIAQRDCSIGWQRVLAQKDYTRDSLKVSSERLPREIGKIEFAESLRRISAQEIAQGYFSREYRAAILLRAIAQRLYFAS